MQYEYKVIPAPAKPRKTPGVKGAEAKFAVGIEAAMNEYAADGWEYLRADILPSEERRGFRSSQTVYRTVLVFRRAFGAQMTGFDDTEAPAVYAAAPPPHDTPVEAASEYAPQPEPQPEPYTAPEPQPMAQPAAQTEPTYEEAREAERRARFSLVGPARRADDTGAPPLSAPHVRGDDSGGPDGRQ